MANRDELVEILEKNFEDEKILDAIKKGYSRHELISLIHRVADFHDEDLIDGEIS
jgi:hypothetical protein